MPDPAPRSWPIIKLPFTGVYALRIAYGPTDPISDLPVFMDFNQRQLHEGEEYYSQDVQLAMTLTSVKYGLTVPAFANTIQAPHMIVEANTYNNAARVDVYEAATFTGGSAMTVYNRNRNSSNVAGATLKTGVTSTNGTLIFSFFAGSGAKAAGSNSSGSEWVLKSNTIYRIDVTAQTNPTDCIISFNWYEDLGV